MTKARMRQALRSMQRQRDFSPEILEKVEEEELELEAIIIAKKAYKAELKRSKKNANNTNTTNSRSNL